MLTPQQIEQVSFGRATFGGYDIQSVDEFLEPLTEDYITLYKEKDVIDYRLLGYVYRTGCRIQTAAARHRNRGCAAR